MFAISLGGNILLFIPLGFFLKYFIWKEHIIVLLYACAISVSIELCQLIFHLGVCDIDDVILNSVGAFTGILFCGLVHKRYWKDKRLPNLDCKNSI